MTDNAKAIFTLADGTLQIEGSEVFVGDHIAKLGLDPREPSASHRTLEKGIDHAWEWFSLHATQRMQAVNFFLVASAFLCTAYVSALHFSYLKVAAGVGVLGALFSICFYLFEIRIRELLHAGEEALAPSQRVLAELTGISAFTICDKVKDPRYRWTAYSVVIRSLFGITTVGFSVAALYAAFIAWQTPTALSAHGELLLLVIYRSIVVLAAVAALYLGATLVARDRSTATLQRYIVAFALTGVGIFALAASAIRPLK
jgi:hypothetical protein